MKKSIKFLFAAIAVLTVASCAKEQLETPQTGLRTIGVAFSEETTKTTLNEYSPVWASGDTLWLSNGTDVEKVGVPAEAVGAKYFTFETSLEGSLYIVYPYAAAKGVANGAVTVNVPAIQDGTFGSANICVGKVGAKNNVTLKNVTAVMKIAVDSDVIPVQTVCLNSASNAIAGTCDVTFDDEAVKVASNGTGTGVSIEVNGLSGDYYASVIPGKFAAGFSVTAVSNDLSVETRTSSFTQTVELNSLVNMGSIGSNLMPLSGTGTEGDPYMVKNLGEWLAITYYVNNGSDMSGQYVKVGADISGITQPVGYYSTEDVYFKGNIDGDGHTLTVAMDGDNLVNANYVALVGDLGEGASIKNLTVAGTVSGKSSTAGVVGCLNAGSAGAVLDNVTNAANVTGTTQVGGVVGYCDAKVANVLTISNCKNSGTVTGTGNYVGGIVGLSSLAFTKNIIDCNNSGDVNGSNSVAGIIGYSYFSKISRNVNSGSVTSTGGNGGCYYLSGTKFYFASGYNNGVGGIVGWAQNSNISSCSNSGTVTGVNKVGGVVGTIYWTPVDKCNNSGEIVSTSTVNEPSSLDANPGNASVTGGIVGWSLVNGNITNCDNIGNVSGKVWLGGIVGYTQATNSGCIYVTSCTNKGNISGSRGVGGIVGRTWDQGGAKYIVGTSLVNEGEITATDRAAGGIIGITYDSNSSGLGRVALCVNKGAVTAPLYAGGIIGAGQARTVKGAFIIYTSENRGKITATRTDDAGECSGGIVGAWTIGTTSGGIKIYNCSNVADVVYSTASHVKPYCGGIIGRFIYGDIKNCYNSGKVAPADGSDPAEGAEKFLGALVGSIENTAAINYSYYLETTCAQASGTNKEITSETVASASAEGVLAKTVSVNDVDYTTALDALNAWVTNPTGNYRAWKTGPVLDLGL